MLETGGESVYILRHCTIPHFPYFEEGFSGIASLFDIKKHIKGTPQSTDVADAAVKNTLFVNGENRVPVLPVVELKRSPTSHERSDVSINAKLIKKPTMGTRPMLFKEKRLF